MSISFLTRMQDVSAEQWNGLLSEDNPFLRHEFLSTLESTGCVCTETGWTPHHAISKKANGELVTAAPLYLKTHSYGEYVFDWAWANAYHRAGLDYYPKLLAAVPFSPITGPKILAKSEQDKLPLIDASVDFAQNNAISSIHWLFVPESDLSVFAGNDFMHRHGTQFHWLNRDYADFNHYLSQLSSAKRKKIRRERRRVKETGVRFRWYGGADLEEKHWVQFYCFYRNTIEEHGAIPYLTPEFFIELGACMPNHCRLLFAFLDGRAIAGAFFMTGANCLYGRYWGTLEWHRDLHFEVCYYQPIEYAIANGFTRFEAGAQGEHKLSRGLLPVTTHSMHWVRHPQFATAIEQFLQQEKRGNESYIHALNRHSPFKRAVSGQERREVK